MFGNLINALRQKGINNREFAGFLEISEKSVYNKLQGDTEFTYTEFRKTCMLLPEYNADFIFAETDGQGNVCVGDRRSHAQSGQAPGAGKNFRMLNR